MAFIVYLHYHSEHLEEEVEQEKETVSRLHINYSFREHPIKSASQTCILPRKVLLTIYF